MVGRGDGEGVPPLLSTATYSRLGGTGVALGSTVPVGTGVSDTSSGSTVLSPAAWFSGAAVDV